MLRLRTPMLRAVGCVAGSAWGLMSSPAFAALSLTDVDWRSYLALNSLNDWHSWLLVGSVALLIVALMLKAARQTNSAELEHRATSDRYTRRIGTMPIYPPEPVDANAV